LDRQHFLQAVLQGNARSKLALVIETYRIKKYIGSYLAAIGNVDGIVFTAGTGEAEWLVREMVLDGLECFGIRINRDRNRGTRSGQEEVDISGDGSLIKILVIPTNEELVFVEDVIAIHSGGYSDHLHNDYSFAKGDFAPSAFLDKQGRDGTD
jgi:acetate kinase